MPAFGSVDKDLGKSDFHELKLREVGRATVARSLELLPSACSGGRRSPGALNCRLTLHSLAFSKRTTVIAPKYGEVGIWRSLFSSSQGAAWSLPHRCAVLVESQLPLQYTVFMAEEHAPTQCSEDAWLPPLAPGGLIYPGQPVFATLPRLVLHILQLTRHHMQSTSRTTLLVTCVFGMLVVGSGCATIRKLNPLESNTLEARRLTREAEAAVHAADLAQAEHKLVSAIESDPLDHRSRAVLADVLWDRGAHRAAVEQMARAVELSEQRDPAQIIQLGWMLLETGNHQPAMRWAEQAIRLDEASADAWTLKGLALKRDGKSRSALAAFYRSLSIRSDDPQTRIEIAKIYREFGEPQRALTVLGAPQPEDVQSCSRYPEICYLSGVLLSELQRPADAVTALQNAKDCGCEHPDLLVQLAQAQVRAGELLMARATIAEAEQQCGPDLQVSLSELRQQVDERLAWR